MSAAALRQAPSVTCCMLLPSDDLSEGNFVQFSVISQFCAKGTKLWIKMQTSGYRWIKPAKCTGPQSVSLFEKLEPFLHFPFFGGGGRKEVAPGPWSISDGWFLGEFAGFSLTSSWDWAPSRLARAGAQRGANLESCQPPAVADAAGEGSRHRRAVR